MTVHLLKVQNAECGLQNAVSRLATNLLVLQRPH